MSYLTIFTDNAPLSPTLKTADQSIIQQELNKIGIAFEQWPTHQHINEHTTHEAIIAAYEPQIKKLVETQGYQSWDVVALNPDNPNKDTLRQKFLSEHTHQEDEVRFFVAGKGLFTLHIAGHVYSVLCERGDFISVPAKIPHWFDMGPTPHFVALRFFNNPDGWIATYTGSDIATHFPEMSV